MAFNSYQYLKLVNRIQGLKMIEDRFIQSVKLQSLEEHKLDDYEPCEYCKGTEVRQNFQGRMECAGCGAPAKEKKYVEWDLTDKNGNDFEGPIKSERKGFFGRCE